MTRFATPGGAKRVFFFGLAAFLVACSTVLGFEELSGPGGVTPAEAGPDVEVDAPVGTATSTIALTQASAMSVFGEPVSFTAIVSGNMGRPTGNVVFTDDKENMLGSVSLGANDAVATAVLTTSALNGGPRVVTATYSGDPNYARGGKASVTHTITAAATTTTLVTSPNPSTVGQTVKLTATVTAAGATKPEGKVVFKDGANVLGSVALSAGVASLSTAIEGGVREVAALYEGSANHAASVSDTLSQLVTGPNCAGLKPLCGPNGTDNCCSSAVVPGGTYYRAYDGVVFTSQANPATVSSFRLDNYEVTVGRFRAFIAAGKGTQLNPPANGTGAHPSIPGSGWQPAMNNKLPVDASAALVALRCVFPQPATYNWTDAVATNEQKPINCVNWHLAFAFCAWDGGRLPTEAEWNYAAAGGDEQRLRPWSVPPTSTEVSTSYAIYSAPSTAQVGSVPLGNAKWGQSDMGGNVWEWVLDNFTNTNFYPNPCTDCANLGAHDGQKIIRGGGFNFNENGIYSGLREKGQDFRGTDVGFRCARAP